MTDVHVKRGNLDRDTHTHREGIMKTQGKHPRTSQGPEVIRSEERGMRQILPHSTQKESTLPTPDFELLVPRTVRQPISVVSATQVHGTFLWQP